MFSWILFYISDWEFFKQCAAKVNGWLLILVGDVYVRMCVCVFVYFPHGYTLNKVLKLNDAYCWKWFDA